MNNLLVRWAVLAFVVGTLTVLSGCILSDGGYGYGNGDGGGFGGAYYESYGADYGG